ncbi:type IV secretion system protein [Klebsiella oxytoca]|uniref:virB8 family protein n=1 Tax=Klebsiella oxytoca TaxID=571 RepID=UPI002550C440|nr:type IV secretion system protein [Klebsiella oxytoca]MEC5509930.1 type IV secretion system protein [Klebsiella oxytoca]
MSLKLFSSNDDAQHKGKGDDFLEEFYEQVKEEVESSTPDAHKAANKELNEFYKGVRSFYSHEIDLSKKSAKTAWRIAGASAVLAALSMMAVVTLTPLKTVEPFVIRVAENTGFTDLATPLQDGKASWGQEIDKYFLRTFTINHESYEWNTIQAMYNSVELMSTDSVFRAYKAQMTAASSPVKLLGKNQKIRTDVISVSFFQDVAQVRYKNTVLSADDTPSVEYAPSEWIATISYDYGKPPRFEKDRINVNPLGFQVTSWRTDPVNVQAIKGDK